MVGLSTQTTPKLSLELYPMPKRMSLSVSRGLRLTLRKDGYKMAAAYHEAVSAFSRLVSFGTNPGDWGTNCREAESPLEKLTSSVKAEGSWVREAFTEASRVEAIVNTAFGGVGLEVRMFRTKEKTAFTTIRLVFELDGSCAVGTFSQ